MVNMPDEFELEGYTVDLRRFRKDRFGAYLFLHESIQYAVEEGIDIEPNKIPAKLVRRPRYLIPNIIDRLFRQKEVEGLSGITNIKGVSEHTKQKIESFLQSKGLTSLGELESLDTLESIEGIGSKKASRIEAWWLSEQLDL